MIVVDAGKCDVRNEKPADSRSVWIIRGRRYLGGRHWRRERGPVKQNSSQSVWRQQSKRKSPRTCCVRCISFTKPRGDV